MARIQAIADRPIRTCRIAGCRRTYSFLVQRPLRVQASLAMLFALFVPLLAGFGPAAQVASASQTPSAPNIEERDWLPARLAREERLEIVIIKPEGSCPQGFHSQLDFDLSVAEGPDFGRICAEAPGLLIYPRIWSGSEGIDLVTRSQRSCFPIAILIIDIDKGLGHVDFNAKSHSAKTKRKQVPQQNEHERFRESARRTHRSLVDLSAGCRFCGVTVLGRSPPPSPAELREIDTHTSRNRGPPPSSHQQIS